MSLLLYDPAPLRLLSSAFRTEAQRSLPQLYTVLELTAPSGTVRLAPASVASTVGGQYSARIVSSGAAVQAIDLSSPRLNDMTVSVSIADTDRTFAKLHATYRNTLRGSAVKMRVLSDNVPDADSMTCFVGLLDSYQMTGESQWELSLRTDDIALANTDIPRVAINRGDWPNAHADALGLAAPIVYGEHDSVDLSNKGMVPCYCVDTVAFKYAVSLGLMRAIRAVYKDGVKQTTGWSATFETVSGRTWTIIDFTSTMGDAAITADVEGLSSVYDGSGDLISNPARQIEHLLRCFVWDNWSSGAYPTATKIDPASFALVCDTLAARGHRGGLRLGGTRERAMVVLERWCQTFGVYPYWTYAGTIGLGMLDWAPPATYPDFLLPETACRALALPFDASQLTREIALRYCYDSAVEQYMFDRKVQDLSVSERTSVSREMRDARAAV